MAVPPLDGMIQMLTLPLRIREKAIWVPSGDQAGSLSSLGSVVICVAGCPVAGTIQRSQFPLRYDE